MAIDAPIHSLFQPTGVRMRTDLVDPTEVVPFERLSLDPRRGDGMVFVYLDGRLEDCEEYGEGTGISYDRATVTYEFHRRRRTTTVELQTVYSFVSPPDEDVRGPRDFGE